MDGWVKETQDKTVFMSRLKPNGSIELTMLTINNVNQVSIVTMTTKVTWP